MSIDEACTDSMSALQNCHMLTLHPQLSSRVPEGLELGTNIAKPKTLAC